MKIKKGFFKALSVFFLCAFIGIVSGYIYDGLQLGATLGIGLGLVWMGVAYFNQPEEEEE